MTAFLDAIEHSARITFAEHAYSLSRARSVACAGRSSRARFPRARSGRAFRRGADFVKVAREHRLSSAFWPVRVAVTTKIYGAHCSAGMQEE